MKLINAIGPQSPAKKHVSFNFHAPQNSVSRKRNAALHIVRAGKDSPVSADESFNMLDSFFIGRALAEVINERLGAAAADVLAEFGKAEAEFRREIRDFQDEVLARARQDMAQSSGAGTSLPSSSSSSGMGKSASAGNNPSSLRPASPPDLGEAVDNLRAEIASTRAVVQQLKVQQKTGPKA